jgi:polysaccharide deacetylase 2 family uncharacterized protein YibQ
MVLAVAAVAALGLGVLLIRETVGPPSRPDLERDLARPRSNGVTKELAAGADARVANKQAPAGAESTPYAERVADGPGTAADPPPELPELPELPAGATARVAIVIDDLGRSVEVVEGLAGLGAPLTYAVLPFEPQTDQVVAWLRRQGAEVICHLPMEPTGGNDPGPGALYRAMSKRELIAATRRALDRVPGAFGANNHMGSGFSAERRAMRAVLGVLAERDLYYLDSRTTPDTVGFAVARKLGMRAAQRKVFLDNVREEEHIRAQFAILLADAVRRGSAIAIAHPYPETMRVLAVEIRRAQERGFVFVPASVLALRDPQSE